MFHMRIYLKYLDLKEYHHPNNKKTHFERIKENVKIIGVILI